jgi:uncharacterized protein (DUF1499 family)
MSGRTGLVDGRLRPCPRSPNCVCSQDADPGHGTEPWTFEGGADSARKRLLEAIDAFPRTRVVTAEPRYLHATFTSLVFRFVDDVELLIDDEAKLVHVRSASRLGYSDLGANRRRVEALRAAFEASA